MFGIPAGKIIAILVILLISFPVHEYAHALVAYRLGDGTAKLQGRLTLNPIAHFDPMGGIFMVLTFLVGFGFGWAKPTPVSPHMLRGRNGEAVVALAGPFSNLVIAAIAAIPLRYIRLTDASVPFIVEEALIYIVLINLWLALLNLIPVPPFDGSKLLYVFMSPRTMWQVRPMLEQYGLFVLIILIIPFSGGNSIIGVVLTPIMRALSSLLVGVPLV